MSLDPKLEAEFTEHIKTIRADAFQELQDTIKPNYNPIELGYHSVEHARLTIIKLASKKIDQECASHLKRCK